MGDNHHNCIIVGAGPGGLATAFALQLAGISDIVVLDRGQVGQSWLDYPPETRLLSSSKEDTDENQIADIKVWEVQPNIEHPTHTMYQRYLAAVAERKGILVEEGCDIISVRLHAETQNFELTTIDSRVFTSKYLIWASGMYSTPDEQLACTGCFIHYSRIQDWKHITETDVTVVGGANGASEVVIQLAQPGRVVRLVCSSPFEVPEPIDTLWKENRKLIKDLQYQGLVKIVENFRVKKIYHDDIAFILESTDGQILHSATRPIVCIGFLPNIEPVKELVDIKVEGHDKFLDLDESHQSKKTPKLFCAGTIGKLTHDQGFIKGFRDFGEAIASKISSS